jgi:aminoglycoside 3-N-acetyltransferase
MLNTKQNQNIIKTFNNFNFSNNNIFFLHTDLTNYFPNSNNWLEKCSSLYDLLIEYFKNHTLIVPSFTYSFCKTRLFNKKDSNSEVGIFTEYFRNQKNTIRSNHPIFSVSSIGPNSNLFENNLSTSSTGDGSIFERLRVFDADIIFIGAKFMESCTFLHYIEQCKKVNYRYSKNFEGKIIDGNKSYYGSWEFFVRNTELYNFREWKKYPKIERDLIKNKILIKKKISNLEISYCSVRKLFDFVSNKIDRNMYYILENKPTRL